MTKSDYRKLREDYNNKFNKAIKKLQKECPHEKWIPGVNNGETVEICDNCWKMKKVIEGRNMMTKQSKWTRIPKPKFKKRVYFTFLKIFDKYLFEAKMMFLTKEWSNFVEKVDQFIAVGNGI